ncbi:hypothetical protein [Micromonospora avicenniae]|nr:hypothetical protein [Micromonospora avicenniae]
MVSAAAGPVSRIATAPRIDYAAAPAVVLTSDGTTPRADKVAAALTDLAS